MLTVQCYAQNPKSKHTDTQRETECTATEITIAIQSVIAAFWRYHHNVLPTLKHEKKKISTKFWAVISSAHLTCLRFGLIHLFIYFL